MELDILGAPFDGTQADVGALINDEAARRDHEELLSQIESSMRRADQVFALVQGERKNLNKLWSDTSSNVVYENNHGCWDYATAVN